MAQNNTSASSAVIADSVRHTCGVGHDQMGMLQKLGSSIEEYGMKSEDTGAIAFAQLP